MQLQPEEGRFLDLPLSGFQYTVVTEVPSNFFGYPGVGGGEKFSHEWGRAVLRKDLQTFYPRGEGARNHPRECGHTCAPKRSTVLRRAGVFFWPLFSLFFN